MRNAVVTGKFHEFGVYHNETQIFRSVTVHHAYNHCVEEYALSGTGSSRNQKVRQLCKVSNDYFAGNFLTDNKYKFALFLPEILGFQQRAQHYRCTHLVGNFDTHQVCALHGGFDTDFILRFQTSLYIGGILFEIAHSCFKRSYAEQVPCNSRSDNLSCGFYLDSEHRKFVYDSLRRLFTVLGVVLCHHSGFVEQVERRSNILGVFVNFFLRLAYFFLCVEIVPHLHATGNRRYFVDRHKLFLVVFLIDSNGFVLWWLGVVFLRRRFNRQSLLHKHVGNVHLFPHRAVSFAFLAFLLNDRFLLGGRFFLLGNYPLALGNNRLFTVVSAFVRSGTPISVSGSRGFRLFFLLRLRCEKSFDTYFVVVGEVVIHYTVLFGLTEKSR